MGQEISKRISYGSPSTAGCLHPTKVSLFSFGFELGGSKFEAEREGRERQTDTDTDRKDREASD